MRFRTSILAAHWFGAEVPYGAMIVNLSGALVIGLVQQIGGETRFLGIAVGRFVLTLRG